MKIDAIRSGFLPGQLRSALVKAPELQWEEWAWVVPVTADER